MILRKFKIKYKAEIEVHVCVIYVKLIKSLHFYLRLEIRPEIPASNK